MNTRKFFPKTFFGRSLVIILIPVLLLQLVLIYFFYARHWDDVGRRLALALGGQISYIIKTLEEKDFSPSAIKTQFKNAESNFLITSNWYPNEKLKKFGQKEIKIEQKARPPPKNCTFLGGGQGGFFPLFISMAYWFCWGRCGGRGGPYEGGASPRRCARGGWGVLKREI